jgi:hypothetical protein
MKITKFFEKQGKKNASNSKALKLIEKVWPDIEYKKNIRPTMFVNEIFETIVKRFEPGNATRGSIFEYLLMCVFFREGITPFFCQGNLSFVPNVVFDFILFDMNKRPIIISAKTSSRERYKQVELESLAAKHVHRNARCIYITYDDDGTMIEKKIKSREITGIDEVYTTQNKEFDQLIKELSKKDYLDPGLVKIIKTGPQLG